MTAKRCEKSQWIGCIVWSFRRIVASYLCNFWTWFLCVVATASEMKEKQDLKVTDGISLWLAERKKNHVHNRLNIAIDRNSGSHEANKKKAKKKELIEARQRNSMQLANKVSSSRSRREILSSDWFVTKLENNCMITANATQTYGDLFD